MSRSLNKAMLIGHVGNDPDVRATGQGGKVATFSLATSNKYTAKDGTEKGDTQWHRCVVWNSNKGSGLADIVERYVKKGEKLYVEGEIEYRQWQDKDNQTRYMTEIRVREVQLLGGKNSQESSVAPSRAAVKDDDKLFPDDDGDSEIPF